MNGDSLEDLVKRYGRCEARFLIKVPVEQWSPKEIAIFPLNEVRKRAEEAFICYARFGSADKWEPNAGQREAIEMLLLLSQSKESFEERFIALTTLQKGGRE